MALRALLVGIDDYADPRNNLNSCLADVADLKSRLEQRYGFPADGIRTLQDAEATIQNVRTELDRLFQGATSDDRLVFMYSGHGFQMPENGSLTEVLVLRDGFFKDDELSDRARSVPPGILTVVLDSCFSGGMQKFFITGQGAEVVRGKVWAPDDSQAAAVNKALLEGALARMEPFGSAAITDSVAAAEEKGFVDTSDAAGKTKAAGDEQGQLQLNGLLMSACRENETASAKRSDTDGLSAFSFALREATSLLGSGGTPAQLHEQAGKRLEQMGFQQRPLLFDPPSAPGMSARSIFLGEGGASSTPAAGTTGGGDLSSVIADAIRRAMATMGKDKTMTAPTATAPATATPGAGDQADEKFVSALGSVLEGLIPMITPTIRELIGDGQQKSGGAGTAPAGEVDEKIWGALGSILSSVAVPLIQQVLGGQQKSGGPGTAPAGEVDEKIWGALGSILSSVAVPLIQQVLGGQQKSGAPMTAPAQQTDEVDEKIWGALGSILSSVAVPLIQQVLGGQQKSGAPMTAPAVPAGNGAMGEVDEKFWGALGSVLVNVATTVAVPMIQQALGGQQKSGAPMTAPAQQTGEVDEKIWGVLGSILTSVAVPLIQQALGGQQKSGAPMTAPAQQTGEVDEKIWGVLGSILTSVAVPLIQQALGGQQKSTVAMGYPYNWTVQPQQWGPQFTFPTPRSAQSPVSA